MLDHLPVFYIQNIKPESEQYEPNLENYLFRQEHSANICKFFEELCNFNWDYISCVSDVNEDFNKFHDAYLSIYNSCCPLKEVIKKQPNYKVWIGSNTSVIN